MKKIYILICIIIIAFILLILSIKNSNSELATILNKEVEIPNNVYVKEEMLNNANTTFITNTYKKDNFIYQHIENDDSTSNQDIVWDFENNKEILIDNFSKTINIFEITEDSSSPLKSIFPSFYKDINKFKYDGKEIINEKNCIKFYSTIDSNKTYFYIGVEDGLLYKKEEGQYYKGSFTPYFKYNYTYSFNVVTDDDIMKFDISNYTDYQFIE